MAILMKGTDIANQMKAELTQRVRESDFANKYVAIIYVGDNQLLRPMSV